MNTPLPHNIFEFEYFINSSTCMLELEAWPVSFTSVNRCQHKAVLRQISIGPEVVLQPQLASSGGLQRKCRLVYDRESLHKLGLFTVRALSETAGLSYCYYGSLCHNRATKTFCAPVLVSEILFLY